ncbi:hypothetical protein B0O80DRAFT_455372 [Mortierella sp. GBAus27b]|nr:hypothetical protein BGX31_002325 [Mortierella sp. GBA43]KAI8352050.1 hypothetical protein B0O80DRAFT_455372 [Mortierella sp. GBAus27b]
MLPDAHSHGATSRQTPLSSASPVHLPEMLLYMAPFMTPKDLLTCICVCRQWHESFSPFLWHSITVPCDWADSKSFPALDALQKNAHRVRELTLNASDGLTPFLRACSNLKQLVVYGNHITTPKPDLWDELTSLLWRNPTLEWIIFGFASGEAAPTTFLRALPEACPNLKGYESSQGRYTNRDQIEALMYAINRLKVAASRYESFDNTPSIRWTFPHIQDLTLKDAKGLSTQAQVDMICQCPNLQILRWTVGREARFPVQEFCKRVPTACPNLRRLCMDGCGMPDPEDVGRFLSSISRLELLLLCGCNITKRTFESLGRHFNVLETLDVVDCFNVKSWMIQQVLESCPNLTTLRTSVLKMQDIVQGKEWAAVQLRHLEVNMVQTKATADSVQESWTTFGQLSRLTRLQHLSIASQSWAPRRGLLFRIESGLDQLRTLTKLRVLDLGRSFQQMGAEEITWIKDHLENLTKVEGMMHTNWEQHLAMANMLLQKGIEVKEEALQESYFWNVKDNAAEYFEDVEDEDDDYDDYEYEEEYDEGEEAGVEEAGDEGISAEHEEENGEMYEQEEFEQDVEVLDGAQSETWQVATEQEGQ